MENLLTFFLIFLGSFVNLNCKLYDCDKLNNSISQTNLIFTEDGGEQNDYYDYRTLNSLQISDFSSFSEININCSIYFDSIDLIEIIPNKKLILDRSFSLNGLNLKLAPKEIYFSNLKGIHSNLNLIKAFESTFDSTNNQFFVTLAYSSFDFYLTNNQILDSEAACNSYRLKEPNFFTGLLGLSLSKVVYSSKVCPMVFMSTKIQSLMANNIYNSFIIKNRFLFTPINKTSSKYLNSFIDSFDLLLNYEFLSNDILNEHLFKNIRKFLFVCSNLINVDNDLFKKFIYLKMIEWKVFNIKQFFHSTQNKWLKSLKIGLNRENLLLITFTEPNSEFNFYEQYEYPEEDFCLFIDFQNKKAMYTLIDPGKKINCSCSVIWILNFTKLYFDINSTHEYYRYGNYYDLNNIVIPLSYCLFEPNYNDLLKRCDFESKLKLCNTSELKQANQSEKILSFNSDFDLTNFLELIQYILFVYLNQIFALVGIITNIIVVVVIANIKNLKKDKINEANIKKDNMFKHILIHSAFNIFYCFVKMFKLINVCLYFTSTLFCSSVSTEIPAQWFKIIFIEYFGNIAKTCCNVSYTAISISRIFLTGNNKNKICLNKFNNLNFAIYIILLVSLSSVLSIFKFFEFSLNRLTKFELGNSFPITINNKFECSSFIYEIMKCKFWEILKIINSFLNDILIFIITIGFDIAVLKNIASMIRSKKTMVENFKEAEEEKKRKRILKMIIINGIIFTLSHLPEFLSSIFLLVFKNKLNLCTVLECEVINECAEFFIYFSIMFQLSVNNSFNSIFKESLTNILTKLKRKISQKI